ncbi:MAG: hypothetical protein O2955_17255 [Planctomycetota bacterium]|nr:hypothetical protein [Planctomycetota bacterium]MDA1214259.1 hypothetical protein [Planctomycetota bacterium]
MKTLCAVLVLFLMTPVSTTVAVADDVDENLATLLAVGEGAKGSVAARSARMQLVSAGTSVLPKLMSAMDEANPVSLNWCRVVWDEVVAAELAKPKPELPVDMFCDYVRDAKHPGPARRMVLDVLDELKPDERPSLMPMLLDDPEFREDAINIVLAEGDQARDANDIEGAKTAYQKAFDSARESGQITAASGRLQSVGVEVSIPKQMGFVTRFHIVGPFHAEGMTGFDRVFPPEETVDLTAVYPDEGNELKWQPFETDDPFGQFNLNALIGPAGSVVGYAYTVVRVDQKEPIAAQIRCSADDNITVWLNGELVLRKLMWLNGTRLDRFTSAVTLNPGLNRLLVKVCQGPQHQDPNVPNNWSMQLRLCTEDGAGVPFTVVDLE